MYRRAYRISGAAALALILTACGGDEGKVRSAAVACMENRHRLNEIDKIEIEVRGIELSESDRRNGVEWAGPVNARFLVRRRGGPWGEMMEPFYAQVVNGRISFRTLTGGDPCAPD